MEMDQTPSITEVTASDLVPGGRDSVDSELSGNMMTGGFPEPT